MTVKSVELLKEGVLLKDAIKYAEYTSCSQRNRTW